MFTQAASTRLYTKYPLQGLGHVVGYCGDGTNDVPALQAADAGLSVGGFEAATSIVAAPVASLSGSAMGVPPLSSIRTLQQHCILSSLHK